MLLKSNADPNVFKGSGERQMRKIFLEFQGMAVLLFYGNLPSENQVSLLISNKRKHKVDLGHACGHKNAFNMYFDTLLWKLFQQPSFFPEHFTFTHSR